MKTHEIKWHPKTNRVIQIPKEGLEYAFISRDNQQLHQLVWCKDFMQDVIYASVWNKAINIYSFRYDPQNAPPLCLDPTRMIVANFKDENFSTKLMKNAIPLLHHVERRLGMAKTVVEQCSKIPAVYRKSGVYVLNSSKRWMRAPPMISFYCFLIRIGMIHDADDDLETTLDKLVDKKITGYYDDTGANLFKLPRDYDIAKKGRAGINTILKYGDRKLFSPDIKLNFPSHYPNADACTIPVHTSVSTFHEMCGLVPFSEKQTKSLCPHWHKYDVVSQEGQ